MYAHFRLFSQITSDAILQSMAEICVHGDTDTYLLRFLEARALSPDTEASRQMYLLFKQLTILIKKYRFLYMDTTTWYRFLRSKKPELFRYQTDRTNNDAIPYITELDTTIFLYKMANKYKFGLIDIPAKILLDIPVMSLRQYGYQLQKNYKHKLFLKIRKLARKLHLR